MIRGIHPGTGDARYTIVDEWETNPNNKHVLGSLCMAHKSEPNSGSCQFYFSLSEQPEFDEKFTVFGQVIEGIDTVQELGVGDAIKSIVIEGADEEALAEAISHELPRPKSPKEVLEELDREREERRKQVPAGRGRRRPRLFVRLNQIDQLLLLMHVELAVDVLDVRAGGTLCNLQVAGDDGQGATVRQKHDDLALARRQAVISRHARAAPRPHRQPRRRVLLRRPFPCGLCAWFATAAPPRPRAIP